LASEDFAFFLRERPGCYAWIGNGPTGEEAGLHGPHYDFNDEILPAGAAYWVRLVERTLPILSRRSSPPSGSRAEEPHPPRT
jgi:metal-dependent amidase/aminoacylase/carboxypeptidase family protein